MAGSLPPRLARALDALPPPLRAHTERVRAVARDLARRAGLDPEKADLAAAGHDLARAMPPSALVDLARRWDIPIGPVEERLPVLLHGPVAAERLRREMGVEDPEVLDAVRWHSTLAPGVGRLARLVFLADKLDPEKTARYPFLREVAERARHDLEGAVLLFLTRELIRLLERGEPVHPASVEARNELLAARTPDREPGPPEGDA